MANTRFSVIVGCLVYKGVSIGSVYIKERLVRVGILYCTLKCILRGCDNRMESVYIIIGLPAGWNLCLV